KTTAAKFGRRRDSLVGIAHCPSTRKCNTSSLQFMTKLQTKAFVGMIRKSASNGQSRMRSSQHETVVHQLWRSGSKCGVELKPVGDSPEYQLIFLFSRLAVGGY